MADLIQLRRDTKVNWATANPVLAAGEVGLETDTKRQKAGDGISNWNNLPYSNGDNQAGYYVCSTPAGTAAKAITVSDDANVAGFALPVVGGAIKIKMTYVNSANNATLNINGTGAKPLIYDGARASSSNTWEAGEVLDVFYDGTNYQANNAAGGGKFATGQKVRETSIAQGTDFNNPDATKREKVTTVGAILDGTDAVPTAGSVLPVQSGGVYAKNTIYDSVIDTVPSVNLFDKTQAVREKVIDKDGDTSSGGSIYYNNSSAFCTEHIPIDSEGLYCKKLYYTGAHGGWACYNENNVYTHGGNALHISYQDGDSYAIINGRLEDIDSFMVVKGDEEDYPESYQPFGDTGRLKEGVVGSAQIGEGSIVGANINDNTIGVEKLKQADFDPVPTGSSTKLINSGAVKNALDNLWDDVADVTMELVYGENILDPSTIILGKAINKTTGNLFDGTSSNVYGCTDFIEVFPEDEGITCNHCKNSFGNNGTGCVIYNSEKTIIDYKSASANGNPVTIIPSNYTGIKYVRFILSDGATDGYAVYRSSSLPAEFIPYVAPHYELKEQSFNTGERIGHVDIDSTHLENPSDKALAKAEDVKAKTDEIDGKLSEITLSESNVELVTSGEGQNVFSGYIGNGSWHSSSNSSFLLIPLDGVKKIKFLAGEKATNASAVGYAIGAFSGEPNSTLTGFTPVYYKMYAISSTTRQVEYEYDVPNINGLYAAITIWPAAGVTINNFYCTKVTGNSLDDVIDARIAESDAKGYTYTTGTSSTGNVSIHAAKEHTYNDGTPPILEWFLVEEPVGKFYYSKDLQTKTFLFNFVGHTGYTSSRYCKFGILGNGDIVAVFNVQSLGDEVTKSDGNRLNPFVYKASENWAIQHVVDFGTYAGGTPDGVTPIAGLKPCAWLSSKGFRVLPNGDTMFGEYTRPTVETSNVWKIIGDPLDAENWVIKKQLYPIGGDGDGAYKHIHCILYDHYADVIYCTTGDADNYANIFYSTDEGDTWTMLEKNTSLNNGQQYRLCMMTYTPDYILWGTDTPGLNKHVVYRAERDNNGILDPTSIILLCNLTPQDGNYSTYGQAYLPEYDAVLLFDREDGGGTATNHLPVYCVEITSGDKHLVADIATTTNGAHGGFRTIFKEWYPINGVVRVGFGYDSLYANYNAVCGNGAFSSDSDRGKVTVNNLCLVVKKDGDNWTCRIATVYV